MTDPRDSAFPFPANDQNMQPQYGLTKLEYFAGLAMQGLVTIDMTPEGWATQASAAVKCAKALIAELNKEQQ